MSIHAHKSYGVCNKAILHHSISYLFIWKNIKFLIFWTYSKIPDKTSVICQLCYFFYFYFPTFISQVTLKTFFPSGWIFWILWHLLLLQPLPHLQIFQGKIFLSFLLCLSLLLVNSIIVFVVLVLKMFYFCRYFITSIIVWMKTEHPTTS